MGINQNIGFLLINLTNSKKLYPNVKRFKYSIVKKMPILTNKQPIIYRNILNILVPLYYFISYFKKILYN